MWVCARVTYVMMRCRSSLRPDPVAGVSRGSYMNITVSIALYAVVCKELGLPLRCAVYDLCYVVTSY